MNNTDNTKNYNSEDYNNNKIMIIVFVLKKYK